MFIKKTRSKNYIYLSLVETYRESGKVHHRTLAKLGRLDQLQKTTSLQQLEANLRELSARDKSAVTFSGNIEEEYRANWGAAVICKKLWDLYRLDEILGEIVSSSRIHFNLARVVFLETLSRIIDPCSKLRLFQNQSKYFGLDPVPLHHFYRALDYLAIHKDQIEQHLFKVGTSDLGLTVDVVFYDVTTLYFESVEASDLKDFGYSKDCKFGEVQVVVGLLVTSDGRPVSCNVYPGNTFETKTMEGALNDLKNKFEVRQVIIVADRGLNSKLNFHAIREAGYDYLVGSRLRRMSKKIQNKVVNDSNYRTLSANEEGTIKYFDFDYDNVVVIQDDNGTKQSKMLKEKLYCFWSSSRAKKDKKDRDRLLKKAEQMVDESTVVGNKRGAKRYIVMDSKKEPKATTIDDEKIEEDKRWDGFYGIQSSKTDLSHEEVRSAYHSLWKIEESFRILKSSLETRPMFHWNDQRIKGHVGLCFLSFLLLRTVEIKYHESECSFSPQKLRDTINSLEFSQIKVAGAEYSLTSPLNADALSLLGILEVKPPEAFSSLKSFREHLTKSLIFTSN